MNKLLIVVDMQNDFIDGSLGTKEAVAIVPRVVEKIDEYRKNGNFVIFTRDTHDEHYHESLEGKHLPIKHCIKNSFGWQIHKDIPVLPASIILDKKSFGYANWKNDLPSSSNSYSIEVIGLCTDICVISNVLSIKSARPRKEIYVDASCCAGTTPEKHEAALDVMESCQINVINRN